MQWAAVQWAAVQWAAVQGAETLLRSGQPARFYFHRTHCHRSAPPRRFWGAGTPPSRACIRPRPPAQLAPSPSPPSPPPGPPLLSIDRLFNRRTAPHPQIPIPSDPDLQVESRPGGPSSVHARAPPTRPRRRCRSLPLLRGGRGGRAHQRRAARHLVRCRLRSHAQPCLCISPPSTPRRRGSMPPRPQALPTSPPTSPHPLIVLPPSCRRSDGTLRNATRVAPRCARLPLRMCRGASPPEIRSVACLSCDSELKRAVGARGAVSF